METTLDPSLYYKSEARPISKLKQLYTHSHADVPIEKWLEYRDRARKDLFWLGKLILRKDLTHCHVTPCRHLFVQKNFDGVYHEDYTIGEVHQAIDKQQREKDMLWLDPRGAFKSTLDGIDCVQWLLNCPDIRILILTGEYKLALAFMSEIKGYFYRPEKTDPTLLQQLFPEYIISGKSGTSDQPLECPARVHVQKEPSLWVNAIVANLSGWHCDIRKMDDVVTDENSNSIDARGPEGKLKMKIDGTDNLVDEWGFTDSVGTRYYTDDYYGERIKEMGPDAPLRYLCRACWTVKPGFEAVPLLSIKAEMVDLLFPEKLSFKSLRQKLSKNQIMFRCFPAGSPVLMADWTEKPIEELQVGDWIVGFNGKGLVQTCVSHTHAKRDFVIRAVTNTGRVILTTKDHEFLRPINKQEKEYGHLKVGAGVVSVYKPSVGLLSDQQKSIFDWLGGILDGEGTINSQVIISQSQSKNPEVSHAIRSSLMILGISYVESVAKGRTVTNFKLMGGRSLKMRLLKHARIAKKKRILDALWKSSGFIAETSGRRGGSSHEKIASIEIVGEQPVYDITTSTGNYVCQGFAVHNCQQLNEPAGDLDAITFSEDVLRSHIVQKAPASGKKFIAWDTSYARESTADYSAGVCGMVVTTEDNVSELHLVEVIYGKWKPSELAFQIIQFELKHRPTSTLIEEMNGSEFLRVKLQELAMQRQAPLNITWKKVSTAADAKRNRIKSLETLLNDDRLFFVSGNWVDETFSQFMRYTGERKNKGRKDDIPDAIAYLQFFVPSTANNEELKAAEYEREQRAKQKAAYDRIFTPASVPVPTYKPPSLKQRLFGSLAHG